MLVRSGTASRIIIIETRQWPASSPFRFTAKPSDPKKATRDSGSLATFASLTILPCASTTHTLESSNDTSIPAKCSMLFSVSRCLGPTQRRHTVALAAADLAGPSRNRRWIPRKEVDALRGHRLPWPGTLSVVLIVYKSLLSGNWMSTGTKGKGRMMAKTLIVAVALIATSTDAGMAQDVAKGEISFKTCLICHSIGPGAQNKVGPAQNG